MFFYDLCNTWNYSDFRLDGGIGRVSTGEPRPLRAGHLRGDVPAARPTPRRGLGRWAGREEPGAAAAQAGGGVRGGGRAEPPQAAAVRRAVEEGEGPAVPRARNRAPRRAQEEGRRVGEQRVRPGDRSTERAAVPAGS